MQSFGNSILDVVGNTPLVRLSRFGSKVGPTLHAKLESMNPAGSMKDRAAKRMIEDAEKAHDLKPGAQVIVATSGNMGVGMAMVCAVKQYQLYCLVDPKISPATEKCLKLYGAKVIKVYQRDKTGGYHLTRLEVAESLKAQYPDAIYLDQYDSPANMDAHYSSTAPEIYEALDGDIRVIVAVAGTGGSSMGIARYFREHSPETDIWLVDEYGSLALPGNSGVGIRYLNGMGASITPNNYDWPSFDQFVDHVVYVNPGRCINAAVDLARSEGILTGGTGGAAAHVMRDIAAPQYSEGDNLVALLPDHGSRYTDTQFDEEWLTARDIFVPAIHSDEVVK
ncbi:MAG: cysteine synthase family protein [Deltaproteobacteria bacterium]|nr:cysteine synthase family protein [Deltaproteobacteria bacterium]